jgi:hypothetical protein
VEILVGLVVVGVWALVIAAMLRLIRAGLRIFLGTMLLTHPTHSPRSVQARADAQRRADEIAWAYDRINR